MLNQSTISTVEGATRKTILVDELNSTAFSCKVANTGISADSDGKKIVKAGTPISGNLEARGTAFVKASTTEGVSNAIGLALHDVDVTAGNANGTVLVQGVVKIDEIDTTTAALITSAVKTAVHRIIFVK